MTLLEKRKGGREEREKKKTHQSSINPITLSDSVDNVGMGAFEGGDFMVPDNDVFDELHFFFGELGGEVLFGSVFGKDEMEENKDQ